MDLKKCNSCDQTKPLDAFYKAGRGTHRGKCISCYKEYRKKSDYKPENRWRKYKRGAKRRNLSFGLTKSQFLSFEGLACHYCGKEVRPISLDRVDNDRGYEMDNIVSCCYACNSLKHVFDEEFFLDHVKRIYEHQRMKDDQ